MDKKEWVYFSVVVLVMLLGTVIFYLLSSEDKLGSNLMFSRMPASQIVSDVDSKPRYASEMDFVAGICALLLVGQLFWVICRKFKKDSQAELIPWQPAGPNIICSANPQKTGRYPAIESIMISKDTWRIRSCHIMQRTLSEETRHISTNCS